MLEVLDTTLVGSPDANPLTYEVVSPHGLSTFSLVRAEFSRPAIASTAVPTATPVPAPAPVGITGGLSGYLVIFGAFVLGAFAGVIVLIMLFYRLAAGKRPVYLFFFLFPGERSFRVGKHLIKCSNQTSYIYKLYSEYIEK